MARTTDNLIDELAAGNRPVRRIGSPLRTTVLIVLASAVFFAAALAVSGIQYPGRLWVALSLLGGGTLLAVFAARSAIPGLRTLRLAVLSLLVAALSVALYTGASFAPESLNPWLRFGVSCFGFAVIAALVPFGALYGYLRRGAVMRPRRAGALAGASAAFLALGALEFHCPILEVTHLTLGHLVPVLVLLTAGAFLGAKLLRPSS